MRWLTEDAVVTCKHVLGIVQHQPVQHLVTIAGRRVLVEPDPVGKKIKGCPNVGATIKPCLNTLAVQDGYSPLVRVDGKRVVLDTLTGLTDGTPPGTVKYVVRDPGQKLVDQP